MSKSISDYSIGVIVARFQINDLHEGHHYVIKQVVDNHKKSIIFLGVPKFVGFRKNPLDFDTRKKMIQQDYPNVIVAPLPDQGNNFIWAQELDRRIREIYLHGDVLLYGGRDSFIPSYIDGKGKFDTKELDQLGVFTGSDIRKSVSEEVKNSSDFRSGIIYHAYNLFPKAIPTVDIAPLNEEGNEVLLAKKYNQNSWRFIGGFVLPTDESYESAARRVFYAETSRKAEPSNMEYVGSCFINDWRFKGEDDKIITTLFKTKCLWGTVSPGEDIEELKWWNINDDIPIVSEHKNLFKLFKEKNILHPITI